jgi:hypothetical protein
MREQPDGAALLAMAREVLRKELMPLLPKDKAYDALMIANAMSIAERQLQQGSAAQVLEQKMLSALLKADGDLAALTRQFAQKIRQGEMDNNADAKKLLIDSVVQRVRESAPKALSAYRLS